MKSNAVAIEITNANFTWVPDQTKAAVPDAPSTTFTRRRLLDVGTRINLLTMMPTKSRNGRIVVNKR